MKKIALILVMISTLSLAAQSQKEDGTWWDDNLSFEIKVDLIKKFGELEICIYDNSRELCIENLMTQYEVRIYDAQDKEIWNSLWTGKDMDMVFSKKFPNAHYVVIKALRPFVVNKLTATRIYQTEPLELKYFVK